MVLTASTMNAHARNLAAEPFCFNTICRLVSRYCHVAVDEGPFSRTEQIELRGAFGRYLFETHYLMVVCSEWVRAGSKNGCRD